MTNEQLQAKFTECDADLGAMDKALGAATERQGVLMTKLAPGSDEMGLAQQAQAGISAAHARLGHAGATLAEIHDAVLPATPPGSFTYPEPTEVVIVPLAWGQSLRGYIMDVTKIAGFQFVAQASGNVSLGVASFDSPPTTYQSSFSSAFPPPPGTSEGNATSSSTSVQAGQTYTLYVRAWSSDIGPSSPTPALSIVVEGSWAA